MAVIKLTMVLMTQVRSHWTGFGASRKIRTGSTEEKAEPVVISVVELAPHKTIYLRWRAEVTSINEQTARDARTPKGAGAHPTDRVFG